AGGSTMRLDDSRLRARVVTRLWNAISRCGKWLAGSFIFCEAAAFRQIGGFSLKLFVSEELDLTRRLKKLAAQSGKRIVVLHRHPLTTSARKLDLYSRREHLRFLGKTVLRLGRTMNSAEECHI